MGSGPEGASPAGGVRNVALIRGRFCLAQASGSILDRGEF